MPTIQATGEELTETQRRIIKAVYDGHETNAEIDVYGEIGVSKRRTASVAQSLAEDGVLSREKDGNTYIYELGEKASVSGEPAGGAMESDSSGDTDESDGDDGDDESDERRASGDENLEAVGSSWDGSAAKGATIDGSESEDAEDVPETPENDGEMANAASVPVEREYDFAEAIPTDIPEHKGNGQMRRVRLDIANRHESGRLPRYLFGGPTACGKTLAAEALAQEMGIPLFTIQCYHGMRQSSLIGKMAYVDNETKWVDSVMTKALLASQEGPVLVLIDEMNRAPSKFKDLFFSFLDDRCEVQIPELGDEVVRGDPENLITVATINEGANYTGTESIDTAELRRYGNKFDLDYLGMTDAAAEAELIAERTPVPQEFADSMVSVANAIREEARRDGSDVSMGLPTGKLLDWAKTAWTYEGGDVEDPAITAAYDVFVEMLYNSDQRERNFVTDTLGDILSGLEMFPDVDESDESGDEVDGEGEVLYCDECGKKGSPTEFTDSEIALTACETDGCDGTIFHE